MLKPWSPIYTQPTDDVLLFALANHFAFRPDRSQKMTKTASVLLVMHRTGGPVERRELMKAAGLTAQSPVTLRTHIHYIRGSLGNSAVQQFINTYMLTLHGRMQVEKAFRVIQAAIGESIDPPFMHVVRVPYPAAQGYSSPSPG